MITDCNLLSATLGRPAQAYQAGCSGRNEQPGLCAVTWCMSAAGGAVRCMNWSIPAVTRWFKQQQQQPAGCCSCVQCCQNAAQTQLGCFCWAASAELRAHPAVPVSHNPKPLVGSRGSMLGFCSVPPATLESICAGGGITSITHRKDAMCIWGKKICSYPSQNDPWHSSAA